MSAGGMAEQLTRTIGPVAPRAQRVKARGDHLLARAGLSEQQHGRIGGGHVPHLLQHAADRRTLADDETGGGAVSRERCFRHGRRIPDRANPERRRLEIWQST